MLARILRWTRNVAAAYAALIILLSILYAFIPPVSTLMLWQWVRGNDIAYEPVALENISPLMQQAVIASEDGRFCGHHGVDWQAVQQVIEETEDGKPARGASTIPMQVSKNLFLWHGRSYIRKALEIPITLYLDLVWSKRQMMEVYLNIAEFGDGIFGVEAASWHYFNTSAAKLNMREAAMLAVTLPAPTSRNPDSRTNFYQRQVWRIQTLIRKGINSSCL